MCIQGCRQRCRQLCSRVKSCLRWCYLWIRIIVRCFYRCCCCCCFCHCWYCPSHRCSRCIRCNSCWDCNKVPYQMTYWNRFKGILKRAFPLCRNKIKIVYLLDPEGGELTKEFARQFQVFFSWNFVFETVTSLAGCIEDYPIALLLRRQTDRVEEDITAMMAKIQAEDILDRIALIYFRVVFDKSGLPQIATKDKVMNFKTLGIILDFCYERNKISGGIYSCNFEGKRKSKEAFETFVINTLDGRIRELK